MKLSKTGWNNVIIFSVMAIIILINATNDRLFPKEENLSEQTILPEHSVILTLAINYADGSSALFERVGRTWQLTTQGVDIQKTDNQIEQMMFAWQQSTGLIQASEIIIDGDIGVTVNIALAGESETRTLILYPLEDQLLIKKQLNSTWLSLPAAISQQLLPRI